jgi:uracil-DNA glycosylase family 4
MMPAMLSPADLSPIPDAEAPRDCPRCPRLVALRSALRGAHPDWWNAPVPSFGDPDAWLAIVGLAPGLRGANRTGRPFTGDEAGKFLFATLLKFGLAEGEYHADPADGLRLKGAMIVNALKCLPPDNRPETGELDSCRQFLMASVDALPNVRRFLALGEKAHRSLCRGFGMRPSAARFSHGAVHQLPEGRLLIDSYHCSRRNVSTRLLTMPMFEAIFEKALQLR